MSEQRFFFDRHGWLVLRRVVSAESLKRITETIDRVLEARGDWGTAPSDSRGKSIWQIPGLCCQNDALLAHVRHDLGALVTDLLRADRIQLLQDTLIVKPPRVGSGAKTSCRPSISGTRASTHAGQRDTLPASSPSCTHSMWARLLPLNP